MVPNITDIRIHEMRRQTLLTEVAHERLIDTACHRPTTAASPAPTPVPDVARPLRAAVATLRGLTRRWAHVG